MANVCERTYRILNNLDATIDMVKGQNPKHDIFPRYQSREPSANNSKDSVDIVVRGLVARIRTSLIPN